MSHSAAYCLGSARCFVPQPLLHAACYLKYSRTLPCSIPSARCLLPHICAGDKEEGWARGGLGACMPNAGGGHFCRWGQEVVCMALFSHTNISLQSFLLFTLHVVFHFSPRGSSLLFPIPTACTCCYDEIKGTQDLKICSHADSLILDPIA